MLQTIPSFYANFAEKNMFVSAKTYEKYLVCKDYCVAHHGDTTCSLPVCKYHILLFGENEDMLPNLDKFCFSYQHLNCFYTLFMYRFSRKIIAKSGNVFDNVQTAIQFKQRNRGVDTMPSFS